jgi:hypothetical protein
MPQSFDSGEVFVPGIGIEVTSPFPWKFCATGATHRRESGGSNPAWRWRPPEPSERPELGARVGDYDAIRAD